MTLIAANVWAQETTGPVQIKAAVTKALPLLQKGAAGHVGKRTCFACHHQALPVMAFTSAKQRGLEVDEDIYKEQLSHTHNVVADWAKRNPNRKSFGGGEADTAGHAMLTLDLGAWKADDTTEAVVDYFLQRDDKLDHWRTTSNRPPSEASAFTTTALALRALHAYGTPAQKARIDRRTEAARAWLLRTAPRDNEERVYRLWGLKFAQAKPEDIREAAHDLLEMQQLDGGWAQLDSLRSDAYATGSALTALHLAAGHAVSDPAYQHGLDFLVGEQKADGSWYVKSRSKPFQPYFETGFPYGKDQWISMAASSWATTALVLALPVQDEKAP
jgi:hypothetical protein